jgi:hypothetical protein
VNVNLNLKNPVLVRFRMTIVLAIALFVLLTGSLVVFLLTDQWAKRVFFFPDASSRKYAGEVRYLPRSGSEIGDIRAVLTDLLLGPSNFGNAAALPPETKLVSAMLEGQELYVGFSKDILKTGGIPYGQYDLFQFSLGGKHPFFHRGQGARGRHGRAPGRSHPRPGPPPAPLQRQYGEDAPHRRTASPVRPGRRRP